METSTAKEPNRIFGGYACWTGFGTRNYGDGRSWNPCRPVGFCEPVFSSSMSYFDRTSCVVRNRAIGSAFHEPIANNVLSLAMTTPFGVLQPAHG